MSAAIYHLLPLIRHYRYEIIFPIVIFEGPMITVISGFLASIGVVNAVFTYALLVVGDMVGDSLYYAAGRYWFNANFVKKIARFFGYSENVEKMLEEHFHKHTGKSLLFGKLSYGLGAVVQITAGVARVNFSEFLFFQMLGTLPKTLILFLIGYYAGNSYVKINTYLSSLALITPIIAVCLIAGYIILTQLARMYFKK